MYQEYLEQKYDNRKVIIEPEKGFIEYETYSDGSIFIWTLYTRPEVRGEGFGYGLEKRMIDKEKPVSISCSVDLAGKNIELSLRKILGVGYKINGIHNNHIVLHKVMDYDREREEKEI